MNCKLKGFLALVRRNLEDWFDTWQCFLTLIGIYLFFSYMLKPPLVFLVFTQPIYACGWIVLWITVAGLLAYRELIRRSKTVTSPKWFHNPNAIDNYIEYIKNQSSED